MSSLTKIFSSFSSTHILLCVLFMVLGISVLARLGQPQRIPAIGQPLPDVELRPLVHSTNPLSNQDFSGKVTVLHFWGTWCPPCRMEFPGFAKVAEQMKDNPNVLVLSVSCSGGSEDDLQELAEQTEAYLAKVAPGLPTYCDPAAMTRLLIGKMLSNGELGYPTTVLVDRHGTIQRVWEGYTPNGMRDLADSIKRLL